MPLLLAILLLSASALAYEVLLVRLFSIALWHHFAYMVISLALLGHGAAGTLIALAGRPLTRRFPQGFIAGALLFGLGSVGAFGLAQRLPFNPLELMWDTRQPFLLTAVYLLLSIPFLGAAGAIALALTSLPDRIARFYRADLIGAGLGAAGIVLALFRLRPEEALQWIAALAIVASGIAAWDRELGRRRLLGTALLVLGLLLPWAWPDRWAAPRISQFKELPQALDAPGARILLERSSPLALLSVVESPELPFRHAPGLSLAYPGELPEQLGLFTDGDGLAALTRFTGDLGPLAYRDHLTSALPYHLLERPRVLILGSGAGEEVLSAIYHGAPHVDAVELDARVAGLATGELADFVGQIYARPEVHLHLAEARSFVRGSAERWDLVQLSLVDAFGAAVGGAHGLATTTLYTVESFTELYRHLRPGGFLAVTRWMAVPPNDPLKLFGTAVAALERAGVERPGERLVLLRSWNTVTLLVKNGDLTERDIDAVRDFAGQRSFDLDWLPGIWLEEVNRYNLLDEPYLYEGARALLGPERQSFLRRYKFHLEPATDDRPYFYRLFRWRSLPELMTLRTAGGAPLIQWSYLILVATLVQAVLAGVGLVLAPVVLSRRRTLRRPGTARVGLYFMALGLAFLFVEIALIQRLTLFLGHPLYAVAVVLGAFLVCAGLGSGASEALVRSPWAVRLAAARLPPWLLPAAGVALLAALYAGALSPLLDALAHLPTAGRVAVAIALIAPLAFLMGMPFPLGLTRAGRHEPAWIPWGWAVNGCLSVVSAVLATLLAIHVGITFVLVFAAALYVFAAWVGRRVPE